MGKLNRRKFCECNICGLVVKSGKRFIFNHHRKGTHPTEETLQKLRGPISEERKQKLRKPHGPLTEEQKQKMRKPHGPMTEEHKQKLRGPKSEEHKQNMRGPRGPMSEENKQKRSQSGKISWCNPEVRERRLQGINKLETKEKQSEKKKTDWQDSDFVSKQMKARHVKQNKTEKRLENVLIKVLPNEYKFVGHGEVVISGKCPDFININGQKKIIELYGDYWHKGQDPQDRIDVFSKYGYDTLVIWEHELSDMKSLKDKIYDFHTKGSERIEEC